MKPWLLLPPQLAHDLSPLALQLYSLFRSGPTPAWNSFVWKNIVFKNRLGLAGGVDKNAELLNVWAKIGCGFVEIGTVTPEYQKPNPGKILDRSLADQALWNKMGFPSAGADEVFYNLKNFKENSSLPVFVNIGKNRSTENSKAHLDYILLLERFYLLADAFVVNISSPNTLGLRELSKPENLNSFLRPILQAKKDIHSNLSDINPKVEKPILLKLSPDLESDDLKRIIDTALANNLDGFVLTNTTLSRNLEKKFPLEGGISGKPLSALSKQALQIVCNHLGPEKEKKMLISVGGVMTADDVFERIDMGADLVEVYTALILEGPQFFRKVSGQFNGK
ncbi:MAG: quinone-dependent dihydroorotate dehydrogenase [Pseudobdellovibrio sp.]